MSRPEGKKTGSGAASAAKKAAEAAAEKARKEAARASLLKQIGEIQALINDANAIKVELTTSNTNITTALATWTSGLSTFEASAMAEVFVTDKFEGVAATEIQAKLPEALAQMESSATAAADTQEAISSQINKLNTYINTKGTLLSSLYGQLQAI